MSERLTARLGVAATRDAVAAVPVDQLVAAVTALAIDDAMLARFAAGYQITDLSAFARATPGDVLCDMQTHVRFVRPADQLGAARGGTHVAPGSGSRPGRSWLADRHDGPAGRYSDDRQMMP